MPHTDGILLAGKLGLGQKLPQSADHSPCDITDWHSGFLPAAPAPAAPPLPRPAAGAPLFVSIHAAENTHG